MPDEHAFLASEAEGRRLSLQARHDPFDFFHNSLQLHGTDVYPQGAVARRFGGGPVTTNEVTEATVNPRATIRQDTDTLRQRLGSVEPITETDLCEDFFSLRGGPVNADRKHNDVGKNFQSYTQESTLVQDQCRRLAAVAALTELELQEAIAELQPQQQEPDATSDNLSEPEGEGVRQPGTETPWAASIYEELTRRHGPQADDLAWVDILAGRQQQSPEGHAPVRSTSHPSARSLSSGGLSAEIYSTRDNLIFAVSGLKSVDLFRRRPGSMSSVSGGQLEEQPGHQLAVLEDHHIHDQADSGREIPSLLPRDQGGSIWGPARRTGMDDADLDAVAPSPTTSSFPEGSPRAVDLTKEQAPRGRVPPLTTQRRSRTGCRTCGKRRKKCDEGKPRCRFCTYVSM